MDIDKNKDIITHRKRKDYNVNYNVVFSQYIANYKITDICKSNNLDRMQFYRKKEKFKDNNNIDLDKLNLFSKRLIKAFDTHFKDLLIMRDDNNNKRNNSSVIINHGIELFLQSLLERIAIITNNVNEFKSLVSNANDSNNTSNNTSNANLSNANLTIQTKSLQTFIDLYNLITSTFFIFL